MADVLEQALSWIDEGHSLALATVISNWGSSSRPVGAQLVINEHGDFAGSVSGGCIESFVVSEALDVIAEVEFLNLEYGVTNEQAREVRLACGGNIRVFVERAPTLDVLNKLNDEQLIARIVDISNGQSALLDSEGQQGNLILDEQALADACLHLKHGTSGMIRAGERDLFIKVYAQPRKLIVVGAVHIAQKLAPMAVAIGFNVSVIDPRPRFATPERLPGVHIITHMGLREISLDKWSAVVALAHDPLLDDPVLIAALKSDAYYIGCLGSRKTHAARLERLRGQGFGDSDFERLHGPVGLDIGENSPGEIAISILAKIIAAANDKDK